MSRWALYRPGSGDTPQVPVGDNSWIGMDMKTPDPAQMPPGTYREGYNCRIENGDLVSRKGTLYPGAYNFVQYNQIYGVGLFSDPNGQEWICVAVASGVWFTRDGEAPKFIPMSTTINYPIEFVQAFEKLFMFRGPDLPPLLWAGDWAVYWQALPTSTQVTKVTGQWNWRIVASPTNGQVTTDTFNWSSTVTYVDISKITVAGTNVTTLLSAVVVGNFIRFEQASNLTNWVLFKINFSGIDQGTYVRFSVSWSSDSGTALSPASNTVLNVTFVDIDTSRKPIPNAYTAEFVANRLIVPYGKDRVAVSDIGDYVRYDLLANDFQINTGQADSLIRVFPWIKNTILMFKEHSIFAVSNVVGDLSATTLNQISNNIGLCGRHAVVQVGNDIFFMDTGGVRMISQIFENSPQVQALPISDNIKPIIDSINWNAGDSIYAQSRRERIYFSVPLKNATRPNTLIVFNLVSQSWESIDTFADPDFRADALAKAQYNTERRVFAIDELKGLIILLEQGKTDIMGVSTAHEWQVHAEVMSRGYQGQGPRTNFRRVEIDTASWNPNFSVDAFVDGTNAKSLVLDVAADRTKYEIWGRKPWNVQNLNDDHATDYRQDYSVMLPLRIGHNGVQIERQQERSNRFQVGMYGRYCQLRISNDSGYLGLRAIVFEGMEDQRAERSQL